MIYLTKYFHHTRHQDSKLHYNKLFFFVAWCLCGYSFRFIRVGVGAKKLSPASNDVKGVAAKPLPRFKQLALSVKTFILPLWLE
jgi:hypothetical protein